MKILYQADDGKLFENEWDCEEYEAKIVHSHLKNITFFTIEDCPYFMNDDNIFSDDIYYDCWKITVHNIDELNDLIWLVDYCGWCEFEQITEPGTWIRHETDSFFHEGYWVKIK